MDRKISLTKQDLDTWNAFATVSQRAANAALVWQYYSMYHPSWDSDEVLRDYKNNVSIPEAYRMRGIEQPALD